MARATWKGVLKLALLEIPIKVYPATESGQTLSFNQLHGECSSRISQKHWCAACKREVPNSEIVKGFEFEKDRYVILQPAELEAVQPPSTRVIDLVQVAEASALEPRAIDRAYYLVPDGPDGGPGARAYAVLNAALAGRVGIGKLAIYSREYLVAVGAQGPALMLYTLHAAAELRPIELGSIWSSVSTTELALASQVLGALERPLDLVDFTDQYQIDLRRLIDDKVAGHEIVVPPALEPGPVLSLIDALTLSLEAVSMQKVPVKTGKARMAKATVPSARKRA